MAIGFIIFKSSTAYAIPVGPAGVSSGLSLWLSASNGVQRAGGGSALNGEDVELWRDQSLAGRDAVKDSTAAVYSNDGLNFNPTLTFTDDNYISSDAGLPSGGSDRSIFVVAAANNGGWRYVLGAGTFGNNNGFDFGHNSNDASVFITTHSAQAASASNWYPYGSARLAYGAVDSASLYIAVNGATPGIGSGAGGVNTVLDGALNIGANSSGVEQWDGNISEVIMYDRVVTAAERQQINSYLALKYGFSLDQSMPQSYLASDNVIMWNKDAPGANVYNNGLFGIGRDDAAGLSQVKSLGQTETNMITVEAEGEGTNTSPAFNDISNLEFLVIGDNNQAANWTTTGAPGSYSILERQWMKQETGDVGPVSLSFNMDNPYLDIPSALGDGYYYFIYDTNNDGSLADETPTALIDQGGGIWKTSVDVGIGGLFTIATSASPAIVALSPADNLTNVAISSNLQIVFSRSVTAGAGTLSIYKANGQLVEQILAADTTRVSGGGTTTITLNPSRLLTPDTDYYVLISANAFTDAPDFAPGITSSTAWNFKTAGAGDVAPGVTNPGVPNTGAERANTAFALLSGFLGTALVVLVLMLSRRIYKKS